MLPPRFGLQKGTLLGFDQRRVGVWLGVNRSVAPVCFDSLEQRVRSIEACVQTSPHIYITAPTCRLGDDLCIQKFDARERMRGTTTKFIGTSPASTVKYCVHDVLAWFP